MKKFILLFALFHFSLFAQVPVEDSTSSARVANDALELRHNRKMAVGFSVLGPSGLAGVMAELNFSADTSFVGGFGIGSHFQAFHLQVKHVFGGTWFAPYVSGGYARWYTAGPQGQLDSTQPGFLANRFLSADELRRGDFQHNIIFPSAGIQYLQLSGDFAGSSLYIEVVGLLDLNALMFVPTGSTGFLYYF